VDPVTPLGPLAPRATRGKNVRSLALYGGYDCSLETPPPSLPFPCRRHSVISDIDYCVKLFAMKYIKPSSNQVIELVTRELQQVRKDVAMALSSTRAHTGADTSTPRLTTNSHGNFATKMMHRFHSVCFIFRGSGGGKRIYITIFSTVRLKKNSNYVRR